MIGKYADLIRKSYENCADTEKYWPCFYGALKVPRIRYLNNENPEEPSKYGIISDIFPLKINLRQNDVKALDSGRKKLWFKIETLNISDHSSTFLSDSITKQIFEQFYDASEKYPKPQTKPKYFKWTDTLFYDMPHSTL